MFFEPCKSFSIAEIKKAIKSISKILGNENAVINSVAPIETAVAGEITSFHNKKYIDKLKNTKSSVCIIKEEDVHHAPEGLNLIISEDPYYTYSEVLNLFYKDEEPSKEIDTSARVAKSSTIAAGATIDHGAVISEGVEIGENCYIGANAYIGKGVKIGANTIIKPNSSIEYAIIGEKCLIHSGVRIGQDGFGFAFYQGKHHKVKQIGCVKVGNNVEIGANTTIDRGAVADTTIGEGTKIDNLVQIGHNVKIGNHCIIVAQTGIAGSTELGDYVVVGGQVGIAGHIKIGDGVQIAAQSGVKDNVPPKTVIGGYPAVNIRDWHKQTILLKRMIKNKG